MDRNNLQEDELDEALTALTEAPELRARISELEADNEKRRAVWQAELDSQYETLDAKFRTIAELETERDSAKTELEWIRAQHGMRGVRIGELEAERGELRQEVERLKTKLNFWENGL